MGGPSKSHEAKQPASWCQAWLCSQRVQKGCLLCERHARMVPDELAARLVGIDHQNLILQTLSEETLYQLDVLARVLEAIQTAEGVPEDERWNPYRFRHNQFVRALEIGRQAPGPGRGIGPPGPSAPAVQGTLLDTRSIRRGPWT